QAEDGIRYRNVTGVQTCALPISKFGFVQTSLGILPGWGGGALLYEKVHPSFAFHWITEANVYGAQMLQDKGWLHHVIAAENWVRSEERRVGKEEVSGTGAGTEKK